MPIECVALIVRHSPLRTLLHCISSCQACHEVAALDDVWRDLFHRTAGEQAATVWFAAQRLPTEPPLSAPGGYRAAFRAYCLSGSPIVVQLEPTRTLVGFAKEGVHGVHLVECGARCNGVLVPDRFDAMGQSLLGALRLTSLRSMSVCVLVAPQHGQSARLGSAPARPLCLLRAHLASLGGLALPGWAPASGTPDKGPPLHCV